MLFAACKDLVGQPGQRWDRRSISVVCRSGSMTDHKRRWSVLPLVVFAAFSLHAPLDEPALTQYRQSTPAVIVALSNTGPEASARAESILPKESAIVLGTRWGEERVQVDQRGPGGPPYNVCGHIGD